jgi:hypothetical protein
VTKSKFIFDLRVLYFIEKVQMLDEIFIKSRSVEQLDEIIFSSGASRVTVPDELNEMVQYCASHVTIDVGSRSCGNGKLRCFRV